MKEVTYDEWRKNPTPRMMWVWDSNENVKQQRKVIYFLDPGISYSVLALTEDKIDTEHFKHCAEIEEPKTRRMTHKELSRWLKEKPTREWKYTDGDYAYSVYCYKEEYADEEVHDSILIREDDGEWREPLVELE